MKKNKAYKFKIPVLWRNGEKLRFVNYRINKDGIIKNRYGLRLKLRKDYKGYVTVDFRLNKKKYSSIKIHRLLYETFIGRINNQINHKDGNKDNFSLSNLEDVTQSENMQHAKEMGLNWTEKWSEMIKKTNSGKNCVWYGKYGEASPVSKVSDLDVIKIRKLNYVKGKTGPELSVLFGVSKGCIQHILMGHTHNPEHLTIAELKEEYCGIA